MGTMLQKLAPAIAVNRFGLGAQPGELAAVGGDGRDWLRAQLKDPAPPVNDGGLQASSEILVEALDLRREIRAARFNPNSEAGDALLKVPQLLRPIYMKEATVRFRQAVTTDRPFLERLSQFWANHFAVSVDKSLLLGLAGSLERE